MYTTLQRTINDNNKQRIQNTSKDHTRHEKTTRHEKITHTKWEIIKMVYYYISYQTYEDFLDSIVVSISACHADDPGSIPGRGEYVL